MRDAILTFGRYELDLSLSELRLDGRAIELPPLTFRLLSYLALNHMRSVSQDEILEELWGGVAVSSSVLPQAIKHARRAVGDSGREQKVIKTIRGIGYRFVAEITESPDPPAVSSATFIGRAGLCDELGSFLDRASAGNGSLLLLTGDPGIGKSRTCEEAARQAARRGFLVTRGAAIAQAGTPPYWPWISILRDLSTARPIRHLSEEIQRFAPQLLDPSLTADLVGEGVGDETARFRLFDAVNRCLHRASEIGPLFLFLDDLHDAGASTLELLEFVTRELHSVPILVVAAYRKAEALRDPTIASVLSRIAQLPTVHPRELAPLDDEEATHLVQAHCSVALPPDLAATLAHRSAGNPFYAIEIARFLRGELDRGSCLEVEEIQKRLPYGIQHLMAERLGSLSSTTRQVLESAAALGGRVESALLKAAEPEQDVASAIDEACEAGILVEIDRDRVAIAFSHELLREAIYSELASQPDECRRTHLRIAKAMETRGEDHVVDMAFHFTVAAPLGGSARTIEYLLRAAAHAKSVFDDEQAWLLYRQALTLFDRFDVEDDELRFNTVFSAGELAVRGPRVELARGLLGEAIQIARRRGWVEPFCRAVLAYGYRSEIVGTSESEIVLFMNEALELLGPSSPALRARLLSRLAIEIRYRDGEGLEHGLELLDEAIETARSARDALALARALEDASGIRWSADDPEGWIELNREIVRAATEARDIDLAFRGVKGLATGYMEIGDRVSMLREIDNCHAMAAEWPSPYFRGVSTSLTGAIAMLEGRFKEGEACAIEVMQTGIPGITPLASVQLYYHRLESARLGELEAATRSLAERMPGVKAWRFAIVRLLVSMDRLDEAADEIRSIGPVDDLPRDRNWLPGMALHAECLAALEDRPGAEEQFERLRPYARINVILGNGSLFYGNTAYFLGLLATTLGRWKDAEKLFDSAHSMHEGLESRPWVVRTGIARARLCEARGDRDEALALVERFETEAEALGMVALARQAAGICMPS